MAEEAPLYITNPFTGKRLKPDSGVRHVLDVPDEAFQKLSPLQLEQLLRELLTYGIEVGKALEKVRRLYAGGECCPVCKSANCPAITEKIDVLRKPCPLAKNIITVRYRG